MKQKKSATQTAHNNETGLGALLHLLADLLDRGSEEDYQAFDLRMRPRYTPILRAFCDQPITIKELCDTACVTQGALSQTVKLMEEDGLICRTACEDGRSRKLHLTVKGKELQTALLEHWSVRLDAIDTLEKELGAPLRHILKEALSALRENSFAKRINEARRELHHPKMINDKSTETIKNITNPFTTGGADYAQNRPTYPMALAQSLASLCNEPFHAVDIGCGTGQLSVLLAEHFKKVSAIDPSKSQLENAQSHDNITYIEAYAEETGLEDNSANLITAAQAAHWFNFDQFYREARRIAQPGCVLALLSYGVPALEDDEAGERFAALYWQDIHTYWPSERAHVEDGYRTLPFPFDPISIPDIQIEREWSYQELRGYIDTWSAIKKARESGADAKVEIALAELKSLWGNPTQKRRIRWPINGRLARL